MMTISFYDELNLSCHAVRRATSCGSIASARNSACEDGYARDARLAVQGGGGWSWEDFRNDLQVTSARAQTSLVNSKELARLCEPRRAVP